MSELVALVTGSDLSINGGQYMHRLSFHMPIAGGPAGLSAKGCA
jgi:hypothetical protein